MTTETVNQNNHVISRPTVPLQLPEKFHSSSLRPESESFESKRHQIEEQLGNNPLHQFKTNELNVGTYVTGSQIQVVNTQHVEESKPSQAIDLFCS